LNPWQRKPAETANETHPDGIPCRSDHRYPSFFSDSGLHCKCNKEAAMKLTDSFESLILLSFVLVAALQFLSQIAH
jgi:hypothetical protein